MKAIMTVHFGKYPVQMHVAGDVVSYSNDQLLGHPLFKAIPVANRPRARADVWITTEALRASFGVTSNARLWARKLLLSEANDLALRIIDHRRLDEPAEVGMLFGLPTRMHPKDHDYLNVKDLMWSVMSAMPDTYEFARHPADADVADAVFYEPSYVEDWTSMLATDDLLDVFRQVYKAEPILDGVYAHRGVATSFLSFMCAEFALLLAREAFSVTRKEQVDELCLHLHPSNFTNSALAWS